eukprot:6936911-Alexandrium_andersonii.AAC.1
MYACKTNAWCEKETNNELQTSLLPALHSFHLRALNSPRLACHGEGALSTDHGDFDGLWTTQEVHRPSCARAGSHLSLIHI